MSQPTREQQIATIQKENQVFITAYNEGKISQSDFNTAISYQYQRLNQLNYTPQVQAAPSATNPTTRPSFTYTSPDINYANSPHLIEGINQNEATRQNLVQAFNENETYKQDLIQAFNENEAYKQDMIQAFNEVNAIPVASSNDEALAKGYASYITPETKKQAYTEIGLGYEQYKQNKELIKTGYEQYNQDLIVIGSKYETYKQDVVNIDSAKREQAKSIAAAEGLGLPKELGAKYVLTDIASQIPEGYMIAGYEEKQTPVPNIFQGEKITDTTSLQFTLQKKVTPKETPTTGSPNSLSQKILDTGAAMPTLGLSQKVSEALLGKQPAQAKAQTDKLLGQGPQNPLSAPAGLVAAGESIILNAPRVGMQVLSIGSEVLPVKLGETIAGSVTGKNVVGSTQAKLQGTSAAIEYVVPRAPDTLTSAVLSGDGEAINRVVRNPQYAFGSIVPDLIGAGAAIDALPGFRSGLNPVIKRVQSSGPFQKLQTRLNLEYQTAFQENRMYQPSVTNKVISKVTGLKEQRLSEGTITLPKIETADPAKYRTYEAIVTREIDTEIVAKKGSKIVDTFKIKDEFPEWRTLKTESEPIDSFDNMVKGNTSKYQMGMDLFDFGGPRTNIIGLSVDPIKKANLTARQPVVANRPPLPTVYGLGEGFLFGKAKDVTGKPFNPMPDSDTPKASYENQLLEQQLSQKRKAQEIANKDWSKEIFQNDLKVASKNKAPAKATNTISASRTGYDSNPYLKTQLEEIRAANTAKYDTPLSGKTNVILDIKPKAVTETKPSSLTPTVSTAKQATTTKTTSPTIFKTMQPPTTARLSFDEETTLPIVYPNSGLKVPTAINRITQTNTITHSITGTTPKIVTTKKTVPITEPKLTYTPNITIQDNPTRKPINYNPPIMPITTPKDRTTQTPIHKPTPTVRDITVPVVTPKFTPIESVKLKIPDPQKIRTPEPTKPYMPTPNIPRTFTTIKPPRYPTVRLGGGSGGGRSNGDLYGRWSEKKNPIKTYGDMLRTFGIGAAKKPKRIRRK